jgi:hypothetical protein
VSAAASSGMNTYKHGGRGLEVLIPGFIRDLEGRTDNSWDFLWGAVGPPVASMSPDQVLQWMEDIGSPPETVALQRADKNMGKDIHEYVSASTTDSEAISQMMTLFKTQRKPALRMLMNMRLRERRANEAKTKKRPLLETIHEVIGILTEMKKLGYGRYHGAHEFAKKFSCDRGVDVLMQIVKTADDDSCLAALWAMTLINDSAEERHYETSEPEALNRYEKRKLIVKADGINTLVHVLRNRSDDARELALHLLQAIMAFPKHWLGFSGWPMSTYYNDGQLALLRGCLKTVLKVFAESPSSRVRLLCLAVMIEFMASDDADVERHTSIRLEPTFFVPSKSRSRCNTPSSASSQKSQRFSMFQRLRGLEDEEEDDVPIDEDSSCVARDCFLHAGGDQILVKIIDNPRVGGRLKLTNMSIKGLPKSDLLGESDPYLRVFLGCQEVRTEIIMDTSRPVWKETIEFEVEDVLSSCLFIMCYDWNEHDAHKFICMVRIHLADVVGGAVENGKLVRLDRILESELFVKLGNGDKAKPVRHGNMVTWDDWIPLCYRNGQLPALKGQLGSMHLHLELETEYRHDAEFLQVQANSLGALHVLYAHEDTRHMCNPYKLCDPVVRLLNSCSEDAQANAAGVLSHMAFDRKFNQAAMDAGASEALLNAANYGVMAVKRRCLEALSLFAVDPNVRDRMLVVDGHLGATSNIITPVVDAMLPFVKQNIEEEVFSAGLSLLTNLACEAPRVQETIVNSRAPEIVLDIVYSGRADSRAEAACLIALLVENPENRRHMSQLVGRSGEEAYSICRALSTALCAKDSITDARAKTGAYDTRSAASAALVHLARFGGLNELVWAMKNGDQVIKVEAAAALALVASDPNERDNVVATNLVPELVEMIVLANDTKSRLTASLVLARMSEGDESEKAEEIRRRVLKICEKIPRFGFNAIDPMVDICLRSIDDEQRTVAAQTLACWVMVPEYAEEVWQRGAELVLDLMMVQRAVCPNGQWYALQLLHGCCEHVHMREKVATYEVMLNGVHFSTLKALRHVLRNCDKETCVETTLMLKQVWQYGGLEQLVETLVQEDGDVHALKNCAVVLQPLCAKPVTRKRVSDLAGKHPDELGIWMAKYMYAV